MLRGFYTAASGMLAQQRRQEALSNNIANANTPGYKADQSAVRAFPEMLLNEMTTSKTLLENGTKAPVQRPVGGLNTGVYVQEMVPDFAQGDIKQTGQPTDLALVNGDFPDENGGVFFAVTNAAGENRLTRNGNFTIDAAGYLVTSEGGYVLDQAGNRIQTNGMDFRVDQDGTLSVDGRSVQLGIRYVADTNQLEKVGNDLYQGQAEALPAGVNVEVQQGALERSNVDALQAMTEMMQAYRTFEMNQRVLKAYDDSMGKAVNEVGRING
ncbi:flagellar hook-basal body protein [Virgibacillus sp. 179-BFC.A HS]|uniref:Flagellar hook-basal body protein n=1 Tax=Tigheibacillus jepli TaxID=3035914 RepID=A0ABU5CE21_9BACI|nr:flagellar hook-basal body protein [Virgibacillus sp. 179-BFC.A HS]MDY0404582.1 flagellar hook-basal body protein [Virgibacillus sp. 179-BFC.A HS]